MSLKLNSGGGKLHITAIYQRFHIDLFVCDIEKIYQNAIFRFAGYPTSRGTVSQHRSLRCLPTLTFLSARNVIHGYPKDSNFPKIEF
jgi:hypothetical protein